MKKILLLFIAITLTTTVIAETIPLHSQDHTIYSFIGSHITCLAWDANGGMK